MTPYELGCFADGVAESERTRYRLALFQSWHGEALHRQKRLKSLSSVLRPFRRKSRRQMSPDEVWAAMDMGFRKMGGQVQTPS